MPKPLVYTFFDSPSRDLTDDSLLAAGTAMTTPLPLFPLIVTLGVLGTESDFLNAFILEG